MEAARDDSMDVFRRSIDAAATIGIGRCVSRNHELLAAVSVLYVPCSPPPGSVWHPACEAATLAAQTARRLVACRRPFALFSAPLNAPCAATPVATPAAAPQQQPNPEHLFLTCHTRRSAPPPTAVSTYRLPCRKTIAQ
jgi:hypothetical protein